MSRRCEICGKGPVFGHNVSHSQRKTPRRWNVNLQKAKVILEGSPKTINVCTKCLRSRVVKAV